MNPSLPPDDPRAAALARQRFLLQVTVAILIISGIAILLLPMQLPKPVRLGVFAIDLIAAAVIWLLGRQRFGR